MPLGGWKGSFLLPTDRLNWSNEAATKQAKSFEALEPGEQKSQWQVVKRNDTDPEGWQYATDYDGKSTFNGWRGGKFASAFVRRRRWGPATQAGAAVLGAAAQAGGAGEEFAA